MGGTLADVPDEDTNAFLYKLMDKAGVIGGGFIGLYSPPDADSADPDWTWASGFNTTGHTYRQWFAGGLGAIERCAALTTIFDGDWVAAGCGKSTFVDGCLCQYGETATPAYLALLPALEDVIELGVATLLQAAAVCLFLAFVLSKPVPWLLRRAIKQLIWRVATALCGRRIGAKEGAGSGTEGLGGKGVPQFAITLGNHLDSVATFCGMVANIMHLAVMYQMANIVLLLLYSNINLGGDPLDPALGYAEYV